MLVDINDVFPNPFNPRKNYDEESIDGLAAEMKAQGPFPITFLARTVGDNFEMVSGHRRAEALIKIGTTHLDLEARDLTDEQMMTLALCENWQREDLTQLEKAEVVSKLYETHTQTEVATMLGVTQGAVSQLLAANNLPDTVKQVVSDARLSVEAASVAFNVGGEGFVKAAADSDLGKDTVKKIANEIGHIQNPIVKEKIKADAAAGKIKSPEDMKKKVTQHSQPPKKAGEEYIPSLGNLLSFNETLDAITSKLEELSKTSAYYAHVDPSWPEFEEAIRRFQKCLTAICEATIN